MLTSNIVSEKVVVESLLSAQREACKCMTWEDPNSASDSKICWLKKLRGEKMAKCLKIAGSNLSNVSTISFYLCYVIVKKQRSWRWDLLSLENWHFIIICDIFMKQSGNNWPLTSVCGKSNKLTRKWVWQPHQQHNFWNSSIQSLEGFQKLECW